VWRSRNLKKREFTWISTKHKNGFRYDHALASSLLDDKISNVAYNHRVRLDGISDHSYLVVTIDL
jgi:exonuclease III